MFIAIFGAGIVVGVALCVVAAFVFMEATTEPRCMACGEAAHDHVC